MASEVGDNFPWMSEGLCVNMDAKLFDSRYEKSPRIRPLVDEICKHCPVRLICLARGAEDEWGVWGGIYWNGSGKPDKEKNAHKTDEDWEEIENAI